ncbi:MAG: hypothetical protein WCC60_05165 [Ilumatobacteraceae bacterium]
MGRELSRRPRRGAALLLALLWLPLSGSSLARGAAAVAPSPGNTSAAINWTVDHQAKTITVTVNIAVYVNRRPEGELAQRALLDAAARIEADIRSKWAGLTFKCYRFIVEPHVRLVSGSDQVGDTEFGVELDTAVYPNRRRVTGPGGAGSKPVRSFVRGGGPADAATDDPWFDPGAWTGPFAALHSVWAFVDEPGVYAHEFGHLLGLRDYYVDDGSGRLKPGAVADLMAHHFLQVSPETVTKVIRISGEVDESKIKCPFSIDLADSQFGLPTVVAGTAGGTIGYHAWACDYEPPSTDPNRRKPIPVSVTLRATGGANAGPFGSVDGGGPSTYQASIPPPAVSGSSRFVIDAGTGLTVSTPVSWGVSGLQVDGASQAGAGGGSLPLGTAVVSPGASECK